MVKPVQIGVRVQGAKKAKSELNETAKGADKVERSGRKLERGMRGVNQQITKKVDLLKREGRAWAVVERARRRASRGAGAGGGSTLSSRFAGSAAGGLAGVAGGPGGQLLGALGGFAGETGKLAAGLGLGAAAIGVSVSAVIAADRRRVESAGRVVEAQNQLARTIRDVRKAQAGAAAGAFTSNRQTIERLQFLLGPGAVGRAQGLQRQGFGTAPQALIALQRFPEELRFNVLEAAKAASRLGGGTLADIVGDITVGRARAQEFDRLTVGVLEKRLGVRLGKRQREQVRETMMASFRDRQAQPFGVDQARLREVEGSIAAAQLSASTDVGRVEAGLRAQLAGVITPISSALVDLNRATEDEIRVLEAKVKAQGLLGELIGRAGIVFGGEGSQEQQRNRRLEEIGAVSR